MFKSRWTNSNMCVYFFSISESSTWARWHARRRQCDQVVKGDSWRASNVAKDFFRGTRRRYLPHNIAKAWQHAAARRHATPLHGINCLQSSASCDRQIRVKGLRDGQYSGQHGSLHNTDKFYTWTCHWFVKWWHLWRINVQFQIRTIALKLTANHLQ